MTRHLPGTSFTIGPQYPAILTDVDGTPLRMVQEKRWSRVFQNPTNGSHVWVSRLSDGTASISLEQLKNEWSTWSRAERADFCLSANYAPDSMTAQLADIVRVVTDDLDSASWTHIALLVVKVLPPQEAYERLRQALAAAEPACAANIIQALARTRRPDVRDLVTAFVGGLLAREATPNRGGVDERVVVAVHAINTLAENGYSPAECDAVLQSLVVGTNEATEAFVRERRRGAQIGDNAERTGRPT